MELVKISDDLFLRLGHLITERYGIKMPAQKKIMFQARLQKRLRELNLDSFDEYAKKLLDSDGESPEFEILADYISTNKTDFFREKEHFNFISSDVLPALLAVQPEFRLPQLKFWSAGCSGGQEAYSLAISIEEFRRQHAVQFDYSILATDISGKMLRTAKQAIYSDKQVADITLDIKHHYFLKSKNTEDQQVKVVREIRDQIKVGYLNLMDSSYAIDYQFDVVFLRNTLIYFETHTQRSVLQKVLETLKPGGFLFIGHAESLINMDLPIQPVAPSVYIKSGSQYPKTLNRRAL